MEYKSSIENLDEVTRKIKVTIPVEHVSRELDDALSTLQKTVRLKGFRPGKAPRELVKQMHGERLRWEVANRLIDNSLKASLREHKIDVVGNPEIDIASFEPGKEIEYTAQVSVFPKPELKGYQKLKVKVTKRTVSEADIQEAIEELRESKATTRPLEFRNTVQKGDVIDAVIGVEVEGNDDPVHPEPTTVPVGEGKLPPALDEGLIGMEVGQSKEISTVLSEDHHDQNLKGKKVTFKVNLNSLSEKVLPEVSDEFAKSLQWNVETLLELRLKIRERLEKASTDAGAADVHTAILESLTKDNDFQIPATLIDDEIRGLLVRNGFVDPSRTDIRQIDLTPFREHLDEVARKRVKSAIVVDRIAELEGVKVEQEDLEREIAAMAEQHQTSPEELQKLLAKEKMLGGLMLDILRNKVLDLLTSKAEIEYVEPDQKAA